MNTTVKKIKENIYDLQRALYLECTYDEAKRLGTDRYWRSIHRKVKKIERKAKKLEKAINKGASGLTPREKAESFFVLLLPIAYWLIHMLIGLGVIGLLVFIFSRI